MKFAQNEASIADGESIYVIKVQTGKMHLSSLASVANDSQTAVVLGQSSLEEVRGGKLCKQVWKVWEA